MENKKLLKFLNEIEKLDFNNLNFISDLNKFQFDVLLYLKKNQKSTIKFLIEKINQISLKIKLAVMKKMFLKNFF